MLSLHQKKKNCNKKCINTEITTGLTQDNCPVKKENFKSVCVCMCVYIVIRRFPKA